MRHIGMPDVEARKEIIKTCIYAVALSPNIDDWDEVGAASEGFAGRDI
jgi:ATP-dependent Zn protease